MRLRPRRGGGRAHLVWALAAVLAVAGSASLTFGIAFALTAGDLAVAPAESGAVPAAAGPPAPSVSAAGPAGSAEIATVGPSPASAQISSLPASPPTALSIPAIGVDTGLDPLGLNPDDTVQVPTDFARAGWYTGAPTPGQTGPAVLLGHIDSYQGPAVFYRLDQLRPTDTITVARADGRPAEFVVDAVREYPKDEFPTDQVYGATDYPALRLITCGGPFDTSARSYLNNIVVYAHLATPTPAQQAPAPARQPAPDPAAPDVTAPDTATPDTATPDTATPDTAESAGLAGPPTLYGRVSAVLDVDTVVVEVQRRRILVDVIGLDSSGTPACAREQATAFARDMLTDQAVTLVPDPTLPIDPAAATWPAYLVLDTQQSYTDAAITSGWAGAGDGRYRPGFLTEQQQAQDDNAGMWGPPCNRPT